MKIGVFTDSFRPYTSGVVRSIELFSREFTNRGHEVFIFCPDYPLMHPPDEEGVFRFISIPAPMMAEFSLPIPISVQLNATIKRLGLDIIHAHSPFLLGRLGASAARRHKLPLIFTYHTLYEQYSHYMPFARNASKQLIAFIASDFCNRCDAVITPSRLVMNYLQRGGVYTTIYTIPTGVDINEFCDADPQWLKNNFAIAPEEKILLFVGRLSKEKNLIFLLKAFQIVQEIIPEAHLVLVGKGPLEEYLRRLCHEMKIENKVTFTGVLPRNKVVHCYAGATLFVFPSVTETQGLVIGEAKATGLPVIAIRAYGPAEMVRHGEDGFLTDPTIPVFTNAILKLLQDQELYNNMRATAFKNASIFSSSNCAETMLEVYQNLIENKGNDAKIKKTHWYNF